MESWTRSRSQERWARPGVAVVADLLAHGYRVVATDLAGPPGSEAEDILGTDLVIADLTDHGEAVEVLAGSDAVVHLGNIPAPGRATAPDTLEINTAINGHVFLAAARLGLRKVVWASSETTLGLPFDVPPRYAPVDEAHFPVPTSTYALSKVLGEQTAQHVSAVVRHPVRRATALQHPPAPGLRRGAGLPGRPAARVDGTCGATSTCATSPRPPASGSSAETAGSQNVIIAAADTIMAQPSRGADGGGLPATCRSPASWWATRRSWRSTARATLLGYAPEHSWRDEVG